MNTILTYGIIFIILLVIELAYFRIADKCNIIDKPNGRSSHSTIVLRAGWRNHLLAGDVDMGGILRVLLSVVLGCRDFDCGRELCG